MKGRKLGRGLQSLLGGDDSAPSFDSESAIAPGDSNHSDGLVLAIEEIELNPYQPRRDFDPEELAGLAESIKAHGLIAPIAVRQVEGRFQLIAGERRLRAAKLAGLSQLPVRVIEADDRATFEVALAENLQRRDLNPVEKALAFQRYIGDYGTTHEELARVLGVDRSSVTNLLRLLELPPPVQEAVRAGQISFGHARALLAVDDPARQLALCRTIITEQLSVRQVEEMVRPKEPKASKERPSHSPHLQSIEVDLGRRLGARVAIDAKGKDRGKIVIHFSSHDEFERLIHYLTSNE